MNRVIDLPALHVYFWERATNGKVTVAARDLADALGVSHGTIYTALRELSSEGRLVFAYKDSSRRPVYDVVDPVTFGTAIVHRAPTQKASRESGTGIGSAQRGRPSWG